MIDSTTGRLDFLLKMTIAKGAYGKVILAVDRMTNERVVIKKIARSTPIKMINAEVRAGQLIPHYSTIPSFIQY